MKNNFDQNKILELLNTKLKDYIFENNEYNSDLIKSLEYSLFSGGKRIRPMLLIATCNALGGNVNEAIPFACSIEYIHTYSLIHDDLPCMDNDDYRRGKLTNHKVFGETIALLAGDEFLTAANRIMAHEVSDSCNVNKCLAMNVILQSAENMIMGQVADINWQDNNDLDYINYVHKNKTMALIYGAVMAGAYIANASNDILKQIHIFAENYGFAFQLADDISDKDEDAGPNYTKIVGLENTYKELINKIDTAKEAIQNIENNQILIDLCNKLLESVNG